MKTVRFAVTGATGVLGRRVAEGLAARGLEQRLVVRDATRAPRVPGAEVAQVASYADARAMGAALTGVETLFLVSAHDSIGVIHRARMSGRPVPAHDRVHDHIAAIAAAAAVGVERIVYLSFMNPEPDATFLLAREHFHTEEYIRSTGLGFTFVRPCLYVDKVAQHVARSDVIRVPSGEGRVAWVTRDDVADAVVGVLTGSGHDGAAYDITGPEALSMAETAQRLSVALGRTITYEAQTPHEARAGRDHQPHGGDGGGSAGQDRPRPDRPRGRDLDLALHAGSHGRGGGGERCGAPAVRAPGDEPGRVSGEASAT